MKSWYRQNPILVESDDAHTLEIVITSEARDLLFAGSGQEHALRFSKPPGDEHTMSRECHFWVYIMASKSRRIYTGVTNDIERRVLEHKHGEIEGFTQRYRINRLVYRERFRYIDNAIAREKEIKGWDRAKRVALIESVNPTWEDLSLEWGKPIEMLDPAAAGKQQIPRFARDDNFDRSDIVPESEELLSKK